MANTASLETLSVEDVLRIHEILVSDFAASGDPIGQMGVRSIALLESAVNRQQSGHGPTLKYPEPLGNAATLAFGICCDHPFVNGNKRTALVSMLVHLDKNHLCLHDTGQNDLYQLMLGIADHSVGERLDPRRPDKARRRRHADEEVGAVKDWLNVASVRFGVVRSRLRSGNSRKSWHVSTLEHPHSNTVDVMRLEDVPPKLFRRKPQPIKKRLGSIGYRDDGTEVSLKDLKSVRTMCALREHDGVDSAAFYDADAIIDSFVNKYRTVLRRLAKT